MFPINTAIVDPDEIILEVDDADLKEQLRSGHHVLVDSELECARHKVFNYAIENLNAKIEDEKLDHFFINSMCVTKSNLASGFSLKEKRRRIQRFLHTRKQNPTGSIQTCVHQGRLGNSKKYSKQN